MRFITPTDITTANLVSSTRAENDYAAWSSATTYALADRCISTTTHRIYESRQASNLNHALTDAAWWRDIGPTNRWAMFDGAVGTVTSQATPLTVVIEPGIVDSLVLMDVSGTSIDVTMTSDGDTVYDKSFALEDAQIVTDWYDYFFSEIVPATSLTITDLPPYNGQITVTINAPTIAECGTLAVGKLTDVGKTLANPRISIVDYSRKETDEYGVTTIVERSYAKKIEARFWFPSSRADYVARRLAAVRAKPVVWLADDSSAFESLVAYGIYRDWGIDIAYPQYSEATISIEGLI